MLLEVGRREILGVPLPLARKKLDSFLEAKGCDPGRKESDRVCEVNFRRLHVALVCIDDVDRDYLLEMAAGGVEIGVDTELPRVPAVFEEKTKWPLEAVDAELEEQVAENYDRPSSPWSRSGIRRSRRWRKG